MTLSVRVPVLQYTDEHYYFETYKSFSERTRPEGKHNCRQVLPANSTHASIVPCIQQLPTAKECGLRAPRFEQSSSHELRVSCTSCAAEGGRGYLYSPHAVGGFFARRKTAPLKINSTHALSRRAINRQWLHYRVR